MLSEKSLAPGIVVDTLVNVPKFDVGTVSAVDRDQISIACSEQTTHTFMADFVELVESQVAGEKLAR